MALEFFHFEETFTIDNFLLGSDSMAAVPVPIPIPWPLIVEAVKTAVITGVTLLARAVGIGTIAYGSTRMLEWLKARAGTLEEPDPSGEPTPAVPRGYEFDDINAYKKKGFQGGK